MTHLNRWLTVVLLLLLVSTVRAQSTKSDSDAREVNEAYIREHYTKYEYKIPMRDGVKSVRRRLCAQG